MTEQKTGLDALVEEAMGRKLIPTQSEALVLAKDAATGEAIATVPAEEVAQLTEPPKREATPLPPIGPAPDATFPFMVNGVKCLITIHVEAGAKVSFPSQRATAPQSGPKVRGIRGRTEDEPEAPEASVAGTDEKKDPSWVEHPVVGQTKVTWLCPTHGTAEFKTSAVTKREYLKCAEPGCSEVAPK